MKLPPYTDAADYQRHFKADIWQQAAAIICARHRLTYASLRRSPAGENIIFFVDERLVIKIFGPSRHQHLRESAALEFVSTLRLGIETPTLLHAGELEGWPYLVLTHLAGVPFREVWTGLEAREQLEIVARLGVVIRELHAPVAPASQAALNRDWQQFIAEQARASIERQRACHAPDGWLESLPAYTSARLKLLPEQFRPVMLHGDIHPGNLLLARARSGWQLSGLFDFGDSFCGFREYEFVAPGVLLVQGRRELQRALLLAYGYAESELDESLRARLMLLTILYECSDLRKYALRLAPAAVHLTLEELETAIWTFAGD